MKMEKAKSRALITGSFDPVTRGHEDIIRRAASMYDELYAVVFVSDTKKGFFPLEVRKKWLEDTCRKFKNVKVDVDRGYVADYARRGGMTAIIRGVRDEKDFLYEKPMADYNLAHGGVETLLLYADEAYKDVSSSRVREILMQSGDPKALLPDEIASDVCENWRIFHKECEND